MPRVTATPTDATPYLALWDTADGDVSNDNVDVNQSPVELQLGTSRFVRLSISGATAGASPLWHLVGVDFSIQDNAGASPQDREVVAVIAWRSVATTRRSDADNAGGDYIHTAAVGYGNLIPIAGVTGQRKLRWYLALADLGGESSNLYLTNFETFDKSL